jgi:UTP:GlnB (protein PII) uridylyltransferase
MRSRQVLQSHSGAATWLIPLKMSEFLDSMPAAYARAFSVSEVREHANIVGRRGTQLTHAELCAGASGTRVCVVADDRPGLLALVTDALLVHGFSIKSAHVYCRQRSDGLAEAVDFFELRGPNPDADALDLGASELVAFAQTLSELVAEDLLASSRPSAAPHSGSPTTRVYFELEALRRGEYVLLVEAPDSEGLLNAITSALHGQTVRIIASEIRTEQGIARDRFDLVSSDSEPLTAVRLCDVQQAVLDALPSRTRPRSR